MNNKKDMIMRKLLTSMLLAGSLAVGATDYPGTLAVVVDGNVAQPTKTQIAVNKQDDGKYGLMLKNFILVQGGESMPVGNIVLKDIEATEEQGTMVLETKQSIIIENGDAADVQMWVGPLLGEVPVELLAVVKEGVLTADITVPIVGQDVKVLFDSREFQLPNAGFEEFHTAKAASGATSDEPNNWHSFMSCTGALAGFVSGVPHTFVSTDVRPGSDGSKSVLVKSGAVWGFTANGTLTTGQLKAGNGLPTSPDNNAFIDLTNEAKDENGDPFYVVLNTLPDSISAWVKFKQGESATGCQYATMSAAITDGSYYQEPADKDYSDVVVGKAEYRTIESTGAWQKIVVPFEYINKNKLPKGILVTFSTNANAGEGSSEDELYLDDVELVYSAYLADLSVNGTTLPGFAPGKFDYEYGFAEGTMPTAEELADATGFVTGNEAKTFVSVRGNTMSVLVLSADLLSNHTYTVKFVEGAAGVENVINSDNTGKVVYTLDGQKVDTMKKGSVYITKYANGKTVKSIGK